MVREPLDEAMHSILNTLINCNPIFMTYVLLFQIEIRDYENLVSFNISEVSPHLILRAEYQMIIKCETTVDTE